jgi:hypothetical protein
MIPCSKPQRLVLIFSCPKKNHLNNALGENSKSCVFCISFMSSNLKNRVQSHKISPTPWDIQWSRLYLRCDNNVFLRLLYAFGLVFCNGVMCLCLNLSNKYLQKIFKIIFDSKWFLKSWKSFVLYYLRDGELVWCCQNMCKYKHQCAYLSECYVYICMCTHGVGIFTSIVCFLLLTLLIPMWRWMPSSESVNNECVWRV